jgi:hypothetical protein
MPWAVGCLTKENTKECWDVFAQCPALFVGPFSLFVTFLLFVTFVSYFLLSKGVSSHG